MNVGISSPLPSLRLSNFIIICWLAASLDPVYKNPERPTHCSRVRHSPPPNGGLPPYSDLQGRPACLVTSPTYPLDPGPRVGWSGGHVWRVQGPQWAASLFTCPASLSPTHWRWRLCSTHGQYSIQTHKQGKCLSRISIKSINCLSGLNVLFNLIEVSRLVQNNQLDILRHEISVFTAFWSLKCTDKFLTENPLCQQQWNLRQCIFKTDSKSAWEKS